MDHEPGWQGKPEHPFREVIKILCGGEEPPDYVKGYGEKRDDIDAGLSMDLQGWVREKTPLSWSTGIGIIEAAEKVVEEAVANGNIPPEDSHWRTGGRQSKPRVLRNMAALQRVLGALWTELHDLEGEVACLSNGRMYDEDAKVKKAAIECELVEEGMRCLRRFNEIIVTIKGRSSG